MLCLNKRQCHSVILFSVLHIYTGDTGQRQLRYEAIGGYTGGCMLLIPLPVRTVNVMNMVGRTRLVPSSVASRGFGQDVNAKLFSVFSHAKFDLAEELNPEIYATVHASSSVLSAVEKPR